MCGSEWYQKIFGLKGMEGIKMRWTSSIAQTIYKPNYCAYFGKYFGIDAFISCSVHLCTSAFGLGNVEYFVPGTLFPNKCSLWVKAIKQQRSTTSSELSDQVPHFFIHLVHHLSLTSSTDDHDKDQIMIFFMKGQILQLVCATAAFGMGGLIVLMCVW